MTIFFKATPDASPSQLPRKLVVSRMFLRSDTATVRAPDTPDEANFNNSTWGFLTLPLKEIAPSSLVGLPSLYYCANIGVTVTSTSRTLPETRVSYFFPGSGLILYSSNRWRDRGRRWLILGGRYLGGRQHLLLMTSSSTTSVKPIADAMRLNISSRYRSRVLQKNRRHD